MTLQLVRQTYGIAMAQGGFGGPRGIWLECRGCDNSDKIKGAGAAMPDAEAAAIFRAHGWTGKGNRMMGALCPACSGLKARING